MSINSKKDLDGLLAVGRIVRAALEAMKCRVRPGTTTTEINHQETIVITDGAPILLTAAA